MLGIIIAGFIICLTMIFFVLKSSQNNPEEKRKPKDRVNKDKEDKKSKKKEKEEEKQETEIPKKDISKYLFKSIKEGKNMTKCYFYNKGHAVLFCDEKRLCLCVLKHLNSPSQKIYSKNIDKDIIADVCFSSEKKAIFCASKNSKSIITYNLEKIDGKIKLNKSEKVIACNRPYETKSLVTNVSGTLICTIGTNDDTEIQIYDSTSGDLQFKQATGAIQNFQILMGPNDTDLLVSTFMNDISVISFEKIDKFNNETKRYENYYKFKRNSSISGAKAKLLYYCLSNDENFFAISGDDKSVKIFRNYGNIWESKIYSQISLNFNASVIALYVDDFSSGRASGFVGASQGSNVYVYDLNGKLVLELPEAHEGDVISLYITKDDLSRKESMGGDEEIKSEDKNKGGEYCLISAGNDGKIKFWKIFE